MRNTKPVSFLLYGSLRVACVTSLFGINQMAWAGLVTQGFDFLNTPPGGACLNLMNSANNYVCGSGPTGSVDIPDIPLVTGQLPGQLPGIPNLPPGTDTVTQRLGMIQPGQAGQTIPFELAALFLKSANPIDMGSFGQPGQLADLFVTVNKNGVWSIRNWTHYHRPWEP